MTKYAYNGRMFEALAVEREEDCVDVPLLTEMERGQLAAWNATEEVYPRGVCVPHLVGLQAATMPEAVALVAGKQTMSYGELDLRSNQLAHYLQRLGVGPNVLVGLCVERSVEMVIGLLGILKAGGAYVPLDPSYPVERLNFMLGDAQVPVVVTQEYVTRGIATQGMRVVCLDADARVLAQQDAGDVRARVRSGDLAYVIYTSGSTGRPKGVEVTHDGLLNLVFWHQQAFEVTDCDRATQLTSPAFDATGWELWPYLTIGASVYLADEDTRVTPTLLRDWLVSQGITMTFLPTMLAESVMALEWPVTTALRFLLTGADTLYHYPPASLPFAVVNNYGPTEATVVTTFGRVLPITNPDGPPTIGRPIANMQVYIVDEHLRQVSIGMPGELCIGGVGLARGYLNRPELTAEKFIPHPFSDEPNACIYKTGDLGRFLPDGQIAFMGRADHQIKMRGYRIEPNELVSLLNRCAGVQTSVVVAREDSADTRRLVAYIVQVPGRQVTARLLRETLMRHLPDYMVPSAFVLLEALPLTDNGKVDRAALPAPDATNTLRDGASTLPSTTTEARLAGIMGTLLKLEEIGIDDNFFMLGGHSLLGTQVIARVTETFGVNLLLRSLFEAPTVRRLSVEIERLILAGR